MQIGDDLSFLKTALCGGEMFPVSLDREVDETLKRHGSSMRSQMGYGQNEEFGGFTFNYAAPGEEKMYGSCGVPLAGNSLMIYDLDMQKELPYGMDPAGNPYVGELLATGPTIMKGYIGDDAKENETAFVDIKGVTYIDTGD